jgi:rod shape-determining protein MreD
MRHFLFILVSVLASFMLEVVFAQLFGRWFLPNFFIILIVFLNLFRGTRYSLLCAVLAGVLKDSFSVNIFGLHLFSFIASAYLTTFFKMYFYQVGSQASRILLVFLITQSYLLIYFLLSARFVPLPFKEMFVYIFIPQVMATLFVAPFTIEKVKQCALRSFA